MRALITGIDGFVGPHLARLLVAGGVEVIGTSLPTHEAPTAASKAAWTTLPCDIEAPDDVLAVLRRVRPDHVYHLAGMSYVPDAAASPTRALRINTEGPVHVALAILDVVPRARLLFVSSATVYGSPARSDPLDEDSPVLPDTVYGVSKLAAELMLRTLHREHRLDVVVARAFNHTGPGQRLDFAIPAFAQRIARLEREGAGAVLPVGNLDVERDLTDVRDIVRAYRLALERCEPGTVYNVGRGHGHIIANLLSTMVAMARRPLTVEVDPALVREGEASRIVCDVSRFKARTGWSPEIPMDQTLFDVLDDARRRLDTAQGQASAASVARPTFPVPPRGSRSSQTTRVPRPGRAPSAGGNQAPAVADTGRRKD